jgi:hypothetical protein
MTKERVVTLRMSSKSIADCTECDKDVVATPQVSKSSKLWLKDSQGHPSISVTMLAISFWVTTFAYVLSVVSKIGPFEIRPFDVGACGAYFGLILSTYVARRFTEAKYGNPNVPFNSLTNSSSGVDLSSLVQTSAKGK